MHDIESLTDLVLARCEELAECSEEQGKLTRTFLSPPMHRVHALLFEWMQEAGLTVRRDALGNVIGRRAARFNRERVIAVGSHVDTVRNAGKYDGVLGVMLGIAAAQALGKCEFKRALDVIAFSEEEGVRYRTPYLGSRAVCGRFDPDLLEKKDDKGVTVAEAIRDFDLDPDSIRAAEYPVNQLVGYFEAHIEQGPVLDSENCALAIVSDIAGQSRFSIKFIGKSGHAGTTPMDMRSDPMVAAAEFVTAINKIVLTNKGLRATVGRFSLQPNVANVIPELVELSLDVRHADDSIRKQATSDMKICGYEIAKATVAKFELRVDLDESAVQCNTDMNMRLTKAMTSCGHLPSSLVSGAGHDAVIMATRCPVAMLFIRSPGGISHHPDESVRREDVRAALEVMIRFLEVELNLE